MTANKEDTTLAVEKKETSLSTLTDESLMDDWEVASDQLIIPRLTLLQALSNAVQDDGQKQGTFYNSVTKENYGESVELITIKPSFGAILFRKGEGMKCRSTDGITNIFGDKCEKCPFNAYYKKWTNGTAPECQATVDILALESKSMQPMVITFRSFAKKAGQSLVTSMRLQRQLLAFRLGSNKQKNELGTFYVQSVKTTRAITDEERAAVKHWKDALADKTYDISEEG